jgi:hypothetical protein
MIGGMGLDWPASFEEALGADGPTAALRAAVVSVRRAGTEQGTAMAQLTALRNHLRAAGREEDEDVVLEVMDFLAGWSAPHTRID